MTANAHLYGLAALQPIDNAFDFDLSRADDVNALKSAIQNFKPLYCDLVSWPCALWNLFNTNMNYGHGLQELAELREAELPAVEVSAWACEEQASYGRLFHSENPVNSRLWRLLCVQKILMWQRPMAMLVHTEPRTARASPSSNRIDEYAIEAPSWATWVTNCH